VHSNIKVIVPDKQYENPRASKSYRRSRRRGSPTITEFEPNVYLGHSIAEIAKSNKLSLSTMYIASFASDIAKAKPNDRPPMIESDIKAFINSLGYGLPAPAASAPRILAGIFPRAPAVRPPTNTGSLFRKLSANDFLPPALGWKDRGFREVPMRPVLRSRYSNRTAHVHKTAGFLPASKRFSSTAFLVEGRKVHRRTPGLVLADRAYIHSVGKRALQAFVTV